LSYLKILSYTLLLLNCRWFTSIILLARAPEVVSLSGNWHPVVPWSSRRRLLIRSRRSMLSCSSRSLLSRSRRSLLSHNRRRSLLSHNTRWMSSTARVTAMTHLTTPLSDPDDSDSEPEPVRAASEFYSYGEESPTMLAQLHGLLF
jgi:hypothetical protein